MTEEGSHDLGAGPHLGEIRQRQGITLEDMVQRLRFSLRQLRFFESGEYDKLPDINFVRNLVRTYARHLKVAPEEFLTALERERPDARPTPLVLPSAIVAPSKSPLPGVREGWRWIPRQSMGKVLWLIFGLALALAVGWRSLTLPAHPPAVATVVTAPTPTPVTPYSGALPPLAPSSFGAASGIDGSVPTQAASIPVPVPVMKVKRAVNHDHPIGKSQPVEPEKPMIFNPVDGSGSVADLHSSGSGSPGDSPPPVPQQP
ncbi:MAG: hypothetical protein G3H99_05995 [Ferrovum sp.]|nr:hypothetical protein [Ferrovum sp.]NDU87629.1 hypothetical protein [Ferrovum sp.]